MSTDEFPTASVPTVSTRLAALQAAISFLTLIAERPAAVTVEEVLALAEHLERWAWRDLGRPGHPPAPAAGAQPADKAHTVPISAAPAASARVPAPPVPSPSSPPSVRPEGTSPSGHATPQEGTASEKQIAAIFAIGRAKGYSPAQIKTWVKGQFNKGVEALSSQEASKLITHLKAT